MVASRRCGPPASRQRGWGTPRCHGATAYPAIAVVKDAAGSATDASICDRPASSLELPGGALDARRSPAASTGHMYHAARAIVEAHGLRDDAGTSHEFRVSGWHRVVAMVLTSVVSVPRHACSKWSTPCTSRWNSRCIASWSG